MHLVAPKKLIEMSMWLLYDSFENDLLEELIMDLVKFLDDHLIQSKLQMVRNSNYFNFNIILLIERVSKYLTTLPITNKAGNFQIVMDLLKKLVYINHDYIQISAIKHCLHLKTVKIYANEPNVQSALPQEGIDKVNLRLNPVIIRVIIGCVEYGINRAFEEKVVNTPYLNFDFIKRIVMLFKTDEMLTKISDFSESYIAVYRLLKAIHEYYDNNKNQLPANLGEKSILNEVWFDEFFRLNEYNSEIKHQMTLRIKFVEEQLTNFKSIMDDKKAQKDRKDHAESQTQIYNGKKDELNVLSQLVHEVIDICNNM